MDVPEPVRRYLNHIAPPGAAPVQTADFEMQGRLRLGPERPWMPFRAHQNLTETELRWSAQTKGLLSIRGFDRYQAGIGEMNWRLWGLIPVASATGPDVTRSALGRLAGERTLLPGSLAPERGVSWTAKAEDCISASFEIHNTRFQLDLEIDAQGRLLEVRYNRWTDQTPSRTWGFTTFAVRSSADRTFDGYTIPATLSAGWRLDEPGGYVFIEETITAARFA